MYSPEHSREAYPDAFDMFRDAAGLIREEAHVLAAQGCRYIQIDAPELCEMVDNKLKAHWSSLGISPDRVLSEGVEIINSVADVPGVLFALHLCRGNYQSRWIAEGGYESISSAVFAGATNYDSFVLEYDNERSGSFEALSDLDDDRVAVLGLVSSKTNELESIDGLCARVDEAAKYHPKENLAVATQCGFASVAMGNEISERTQEAKLRLVAQTARRIWG